MYHTRLQPTILWVPVFLRVPLCPSWCEPISYEFPHLACKMKHSKKVWLRNNWSVEEVCFSGVVLRVFFHLRLLQHFV
jgi:hypothetical protein